MAKTSDIRVIGASVYFIPVKTRIPLKFGPETLTYVTCARVMVRVQDRNGKIAEGWGETPLSVQWVWPSSLSYESRHEALKDFTLQLAKAWSYFSEYGHPIEIGIQFQEKVLTSLCGQFNQNRQKEAMPWLAALVCCSAFDIAIHDAYGHLHQIPVYDTYNAQFMNCDLGKFITAESESNSTFDQKYPDHFLIKPKSSQLRAWHLVGGLDCLHPGDLTGAEPKDGHPVLLTDWIQRDGLKCLKVKLRGTDSAWDFHRLLAVGQIAVENGVEWLSADFNCTVTDPDYVNEILDRLRDEQPRIYGMILYVEQPFPYELEHHRIDVHSVSARKPLFLDESAHDWRLIRLGRKLGWTGVALKTCKTQTGAVLSACWAKAHGMTLMVQDLTNPMIAQIPHILLAAHTGTIMGVETNAMQFYPEASNAEAVIHPGLYRRYNGIVNFSTLSGFGFGYRLAEISQQLPEAACSFGN